MYNAACKRHEAGTSEWLIENEDFESWMKNPRSLLWLHGKGVLKYLCILCNIQTNDLASWFWKVRSQLLGY